MSLKKPTKSTGEQKSKTKVALAPIFERFKAFVVDIFMVAMPLLYVTTYLILDGKNAFLHNQFAIACIWVIYALFTSFLFSHKAQTLGYRAFGLYLINTKTSGKLTFFHALFRFVCFLIAGFSIVGLFICFFRKDRLNLHDILSNSAAVIKK